MASGITPQTILEKTIGREYTKPKLNPPVFQDAVQPMKPFGKLGEVLGKLSKGDKK